MPSLGPGTPVSTGALRGEAGTVSLRGQKVLWKELDELLRFYAWPTNLITLSAVVKRYVSLYRQAMNPSPGVKRQLLWHLFLFESICGVEGFAVLFFLGINFVVKIGLLEQWVTFQRLLKFLLKFQRGQLQQTDSLL